MTKKFMQNIIDILIDNLALILTIVYAGYVIYQHDIAKENVSVEQLLTAILWVLGLLATSEIVERYRKLNAIHKSVDRSVAFLESRLADRPSAMAFFQKTPVIDSFVQRASQIDLCGVTLSSTLNKQYGNLRERLQNGAKIRLMFIDVESVAIQMTSERSSNPGDLEYYRLHLDSSMRELAYLYKSVDEFKRLEKRTTKTGILEVRLLSYAPSFGITSIDPKHKDGIVFVEVYPHKFGFRTPPTFDLTPDRDQDWYDYFVEQFDQMWNAATPWNPKTHLEKITFPKDA